ncbi:hypothetical protein DOE73_07410 [Paenibacillus dendritiformis]|nr:hypothetical protein DOE73_07410 [Paenibacillus dendritiformis]
MKKKSVQFHESRWNGELFKGLNGKYKFHFLGQGTNQIRERVIETNKGQYLKLSGRNDRNIGKIIAFIDEKKLKSTSRRETII